MSRLFRKPQKRTVLISLDIGATQTAVVVAVVPSGGGPPAIYHVGRWPGQDENPTERKVPTLVRFDRSGNATAFGAEALFGEQNKNNADFGLAQNFKLHFHPSRIVEANKLKLDALPSSTNVEDVYSAFINYVLEHTFHYLNEDGIDDVATCPIYLILPHPNGWGETEQAKLGKAATDAEVLRGFGNVQVHFVEEAEAAARYAFAHPDQFPHPLKAGERLIVCDAGGSTVDIASYEVVSRSNTGQIRVRENGAPSCFGCGGLYVDEALRRHLVERFRWSDYREDPPTIESLANNGVRDFELHSKRTFNNDTPDIRLKLGPRLLNHQQLSISNGLMTVSTDDTRACFAVSTQMIVEYLKFKLSQSEFQCVILTGGLGENAYVRTVLANNFSDVCPVVVSKSVNSKPVALGALMLALDDRQFQIERQQRFFKTRLVNFGIFSKLFGGLSAMAGAISRVAHGADN